MMINNVRRVWSTGFSACLGLTGLMLFFPISALACSCQPGLSPADEFERVDAVFAADVIAVAASPDNPFIVEARLAVGEAWKGQVALEERLETFSEPELCGFSFQPGQQYLVYAVLEDGPEPFLSTNVCLRTRRLDQANEDLAFLGEGRNLPAEYSALANFHEQLNGEHWLRREGWLAPDVPICHWAGLSCGPQGELRRVDLSDNQLDGHLPADIFPLPVADFIDLSGNRIDGAPPDQPNQPRLPEWNQGERGGGVDLCWNDLSSISPEGEAWLDRYHVGGSAWRDCQQRERRSADPGMSGSWFAPDRAGEGFAVQWLDTGQPLVYQMTFDKQGGQRWLFGLGEVATGGLDWLDLADTRGRFDQGLVEDGLRTEAGRLRLDRTGEVAASVLFTLPDWPVCGAEAPSDCLANRQSRRTDQRQLSRLAGTRCDNQQPQQWMSGLWFDPQRNGEGFLIEITAQGIAQVYWLGHRDDDSGEQQWWVGQAMPGSSTIEVDAMISPRLLSTEPFLIERREWGSLRIEFQSTDRARVSWARHVDPPAEGSHELTRLARPELTECEP
ncbi:MAG: hypothetical protein ACXIUB_01810 [Wenzhouxiangella sp.]